MGKDIKIVIFKQKICSFKNCYAFNLFITVQTYDHLSDSRTITAVCLPRLYYSSSDCVSSSFSASAMFSSIFAISAECSMESSAMNFSSGHFFR